MPEPSSRKVTGLDASPHRLDVDAQQVRELIQGQDVISRAPLGGLPYVLHAIESSCDRSADEHLLSANWPSV